MSNVGEVPPTDHNLEVLKEQCEEGIAALKAYLEACTKIEQSVHRHGDERSWMHDMLALGIEEMLRSAPIVVMDETHPSTSRLKSMKELSRYILENSEWMSYNLLFDDREGDWHITRKYAGDTISLTRESPLSTLSDGFKHLLYGVGE